MINRRHTHHVFSQNPPLFLIRRTDFIELLAGSGPFEFGISDGQYYRMFYTPVLHKPMFSDEPVFANFLLFARYYHNMRNFPTFENEIEISDDVCEELKQVSDRLTVALKWQQHDLLMLDNTRFMHGRNAVSLHTVLTEPNSPCWRRNGVNSNQLIQFVEADPKDFRKLLQPTDEMHRYSLIAHNRRAS